ncbi:hypothetical protein [Corallococcus exiguus]|uniref:Uncharacterized protein n=1 Tax=Corallococcus exiguus TaxID=83462 RepID=A0A7X5BUX2_9BACT|nr:hypothetical protein [Corallococcus exiguus]NBC44820.1 hypothetical protein [Corallococcus exiguus]TNV66194.1 hypothetical protein FH620_07495 [Corallococcus exiguus]
MSLAIAQGTGLFVPQKHGLKPRSAATPDRRGFACFYRVSEDALFLERLQLALPYKEQLLVQAGRGPLLLGLSARVEPEGRLRVLYSDMHAPVQFSGGMLLGDGYIHALALHGRELQLRRNTIHPAFEWREVHELIFEMGRLVEAQDCSEAVVRIREHLASEQFEPGSPEWQAAHATLVAQAFRVDYGLPALSSPSSWIR